MILRYCSRIVGSMLLVVGASMSAPLALALFGEGAAAFAIAGGGTALLGAALLWIGWRVPEPSKHGTIAAVVLGALAAIGISTLPYALWGAGPVDALFESMSGWTTTGATMYEKVEALPPAILLWRALTQWLGGLGILFFVVVVLPYAEVDRIALLGAAAARDTGRFRPQMSTTGADLLKIYAFLTGLNAILLYLGNLRALDSVCLAMSTLSTGGFSTHSGGLPVGSGLYVELVTIVFMILGATNFLLHVRIFQGEVLPHWRSELFRIFMVLLLATVALVTIDLVLQRPEDGFGASFRRSLFHSVSFCTTSGFPTGDGGGLPWPAHAKTLLVTVMFFGGMGGSTAGGLKMQQWILAARATYREILRLIHPSRVYVVRLQGDPVAEAVMDRYLLLVMFWIVLFAASAAVLLASGLDLETALSSAAGALNNAGSTFGRTAKHWGGLTSAAKLLAAGLMLVGRFEVFGLLAPLSPVAWRLSRHPGG